MSGFICSYPFSFQESPTYKIWQFGNILTMFFMTQIFYITTDTKTFHVLFFYILVNIEFLG